MNRRSIAVLVVLAAVVALLQASVGLPSASAATSVVRQPFTFTWSGGTCPGLAYPLSFQGETIVVTNVDLSPGGGYPPGPARVNFDNTIHGTAIDAAGVTYHFNYHNHTLIDVAPGQPPYATMTDHFNLVGAGRANRDQVGFVLRLIDFYPPADFGPDDVFIEFVNERGDPLICDPF